MVVATSRATSDTRRRRSTALRAAASLPLVAAMGVAVHRAGGVVGDATTTATQVPLGVVLALGTCFALERLSRARTVQASLPGSTLGQGLALNEVGSAASSGLPGGGAVGAGVRVAMARSWGHPDAPAWLSIAAASEVFGIATRLLALGVLAPEFVRGTADATDQLIAGALAGSLVATGGMWLLLSTDSRLLRWWRGTASRLHAWACTRVRIAWLHRFDPAHWIDAFRDASAILLRRPLALVVPAVAGQVAGAVLFLVALRGVGVDLDAWTLLRIHLLGKVAAGFAPTPGGVGLVEAGLTAALVAAGAPQVDALAGVLLARAFTFALPILLGAATAVAWRARHVRRRQAGGLEPAPA